MISLHGLESAVSGACPGPVGCAVLALLRELGVAEESGACPGACPGPVGCAVVAAVADAQLAALLLTVADFCGWQEDVNGGGFQLWTLRKPIPGHPVGSTVTRDTIRRALMPYGKTTLPAVMPADFAAIDSP